MVEVQLWHFEKFTNSTRQPESLLPESVPLTYQCILKEPTSVTNPIIRIQTPINEALVTRMNYASIPVFARYYFIKSWSWDGRLWCATMECDVMATYKIDIGRSTQYVTRSAAAWDALLIDGTYPTTDDVVIKTTTTSNLWQSEWTRGVYIVGIINGDNNAIGAVSYYAFTQSQFNTFKRTLFSDSNWLNLMEGIDATIKAIFNPFQYIASVNWLPVGINEITNATLINDINFAWWDFNTTPCYRLGSLTITKHVEFQIPKHPQVTEDREYLNYAPYSRYMIHLPPWGDINIDMTRYTHSTIIKADITVDMVSGSAHAVLTAGQAFTDPEQDGYITEIENLLAVPINLAQNSTNYLDVAVNGAAGIATMALSFGNPTGIISGAAGIINAIDNMGSQTQSTGTNGSILTAKEMPRLIGYFYQVVEEDLFSRGRPLCQNKRIDTLAGGIIICSDVHLTIPGTYDELDTVKSIMEDGFFYE